MFGLSRELITKRYIDHRKENLVMVANLPLQVVIILIILLINQTLILFLLLTDAATQFLYKLTPSSTNLKCFNEKGIHRKVGIMFLKYEIIN